MVDVIGFLSLGLFTAHVTGNLVVVTILLVRGGPPNMAQILAVPVFIGAVAAVWLIAKASERRGPALVRPLLLVQFLLLACVLIFRVINDPAANPRGLMAGVAAMIAVSAMACQFALLRLSVPAAPPSEKDANRLAAASPLARRGWLRSRLRAPTDVMCRATQRFLKALRLVSRPARDLPLEHALEETRDMQVTTFRLDTSGGVSLFVYRWLLVIPPLRAVATR